MPTKPVELHLVEGNQSHKTDEELSRRQGNELPLGNPKIRATKRLRANPVAIKEFRRIVRMYRQSEVGFMTDADVKLLERRCLTHADYEQVRNMRDELQTRAAVKTAKARKATKTKPAVPATKAMSFEAVLQATNKIDTMLNRLSESLQRMDRELLLTPMARISGVHRDAKKAKDDPLARSMFGDE